MSTKLNFSEDKIISLATCIFIYSFIFKLSMIVSVNVYDLYEIVDFPDIVTVRAEFPPLQTLLALRLGAVRADTGGVVVAGDDAGGPQPPGRLL